MSLRNPISFNRNNQTAGVKGMGVNCSASTLVCSSAKLKKLVYGFIYHPAVVTVNIFYNQAIHHHARLMKLIYYLFL